MIDFGDYVCIEQKRFGTDKEIYLYKVIGRLHSNTYVDVPVKSPPQEIIHNKCDVILSCIQCGPYEKEVLNYRESDVFLKNE